MLQLFPCNNKISKSLGHASEVFQLFDNGYDTRTKSSASPFPVSTALVPTLCIMHRESEGSKPMMGFGSFDNQKHPIIRAPVRRKSLLSVFFVKPKAMKLKAGYVV
ncbi:ABI-1-like 1 isoform 2 [Hibiscus syriacus]|uniref:ABI-1-like 1 isoform 2 n=1 Tax=Hibiscus syriacus TaxID=106335 RepID=A0A6A3AIK8_HIBSY|nr:ABI-1-like 1 isoform 2 [Hibiscus syriacus]